MKIKENLLDLSSESSGDHKPPWTKEEFEGLLKNKASYHIHHPFHVMMAEEN